MDTLKYAKYIITEPKQFPPEVMAKIEAEKPKRKSTVKSTHLLSVDGDILEGFFYLDCVWLWNGGAVSTVEDSHNHDFDEVIGFIGSQRENPHDLGGEITIWLDDEKHILTKSCLIYVPAGVKHCPIRFDRIDHPVFFITISPQAKYTRTSLDGGTTAISEPKQPATDGLKPKYTIVTEHKDRFAVAASGAEATPQPKKTQISTRVLHLEDDIAQGSFYVDFVWIWEGVGGAPAPEHSHEWPEIIGMVGVDPDNPHDLGGPMSIVLGDETHLITKSSLVCIPAGLKHCPWKFLDIKKPTLVFSAGPTGTYSGSHKEEG